MALTLYTNPQSRGRIARWMLEEVGAPYETVLVDWDDKPAALLAVNPLGKVPTIDHDGRIVSEAAAVCAYLAEAFPDAGLAPKADERAPYLRWMFFTSGPLEAAMMDRFLGVEIPADKERTVGYRNFEATIDALEFALSRTPYVAGDRFTAADVYVGSAVAFFGQFKLLPDRPAFRDYLARLGDRPAWVKARKIDDDLLAAKTKD